MERAEFRGAVVDVVSYGDRLHRPGLNPLNGPVNDIVSCTVLAAAGTHIMLFTTGRGISLGGPVPTLKISSNSGLAARKKSWIDFDAGQLLDGIPADEPADRLFDNVVTLASGWSRTCSEINGFREIALSRMV